MELNPPDLRGYGGTEKPASGYDKRTMANDIRALLQHLKIEKVSTVGHDRGARVATRFAKDHPAMLDQLVVMDNIPTRIIFQRMNAEVARGHWFFIFNNVPDLPEALISGREEIWLRYIFSSWPRRGTGSRQNLAATTMIFHSQRYRPS
jgi:haloacetate dehalogenase